uniref:Thyrotropin-releasing hormone receptor n=1 Tax=Steinernema glaseri TaxID=37863 RepID=A0A1I7YUD0_9BILA
MVPLSEGFSSAQSTNIPSPCLLLGAFRQQRPKAMANISAADVEWLCPSLKLPADVVKLDLQDLLKYPECAGMPTFLAGGSLSELDEGIYAMHTRILMTFIFACLSIVGIVGNVLVITVVFKVPGMITPTNCYLVSLALSDCLFFIAATPTELSTLHLPSDYIFGSIGCSLFSYLPYLAINTSSLSIAAFTIERFIGICYPIQARYICTVKRAKMIIAGIWSFCIMYNSPWLYLATVKEDEEGSMCGFKLERDNWTYKTIFFGDFFAFYVFPMFLYMIIYGKIAFTLKKNDIRHQVTKKSHSNN